MAGAEVEVTKQQASLRATPARAAVHAALLLAVFGLSACTGGERPAPAGQGAPAPAASSKGEATMALTLQSTGFTAAGDMPERFTCEGGDHSPPLSWSGAPEGTRSFALIVDDPDAPDPAAPQRTWVHWVVYNLPAGATDLAEDASTRIPHAAVEGLNDFGRTSYGGPCPPVGRHRYFHKLYALDTEFPAGAPMDKAALERAMQGHVLAQAELIGTYQKKGK